MRRMATGVLLTAVLLLGGCLVIGGRKTSDPPTLGTQLLDLKVAYDQGALTTAEYEQAKRVLLSSAPSLASNYY